MKLGQTTIDFTITSSFKQILLLSVGVVLIVILIGDFLLYGCVVVLLAIFSIFLGEQFVLSLIIISLFTLVGDVSPSLRLAVQITDFSILGILFIKKYNFAYNNFPTLPKSLLYFLLLYYLSMIISSLLSDNYIAGFEKIVRQTVFFIIVYIFYALIKSEKEIKTYTSAIIIVSIILTASSIVLFYLDGFRILDLAIGVRFRVSSIIKNVDTTTAFFIIAYPLLISSLLLSKTKEIKNLNLFVLIFITIGLFLTISRSAFLSIFFSILFFFYYANKKVFFTLLFTLSLIALTVFIVKPLSELSSLMFRIDSGLSKRDYLWSLAYNIIRDNWLFGIGPGNYALKMYNYFPIMMDSWFGQVITETSQISQGNNLSHSFFLVFFTDMGIPGLLTAFALPAVYMRIAHKTINRYKESEKKTYLTIVAISGAGASMFVRGIVDSIGLLAYGYITADLPFWLMFIGLIYYYQHNDLIENCSEVKLQS